MDVTNNRRLYRTVQKSKTISHEHGQSVERIETNSIFQDQSETFNTKDYQYASQKASSICCESKIYYPEGKDSQAYVWNISQLWISSKQQGDSQPKSKMYEDIGVDSEICPNIRGKNGMRLSFGQLCRVGTIGIAKRKNKGIQCNYVYVKYEHKNGGDGPVCTMLESSGRNESEGLGLGVSMVVYTFVDESVRRNIASSIHIRLIDSKDLEKHDDFYEPIAEFGFEHIIVIGETYNGLLFLDCYERVFKWQQMQQTLWPLGDSLEEVESRLKSNKQIDRVVWTAEYDGVKYQALPDYDVEAAERAQRAERARKTKTKGVKNKYLKNKKK
ncbi:hypothetical protein GLOIN_2v1477433 [Rhizophagus irregularis DAOM 181602=DAOM 197198]|nr:hypothetical protein GLOIN_2v1477433 [Rhizophagus irregularis DAOM 181602=DAOM 197198]